MGQPGSESSAQPMENQQQIQSSDPASTPVRPVRIPREEPPSFGVPGSQAPGLEGLSKRRLAIAFVIAGVSDVISAFFSFAPPVELPVDFVTALLLFSVLGWRWLLLPGLVMEAVPGLSVFPFWVLVVGAIAVWGTARPKIDRDGPLKP